MRIERRERTRGYEGREGEYEGRAGDERNTNANAQTPNAEHEETKRNETTHPLAPHPRIGTHPSACIPTPSPVTITISILTPTPTPHPLHHRDACPTQPRALRCEQTQTQTQTARPTAPSRSMHRTNERTRERREWVSADEGVGQAADAGHTMDDVPASWYRVPSSPTRHAPDARRIRCTKALAPAIPASRQCASSWRRLSVRRCACACAWAARLER